MFHVSGGIHGGQLGLKEGNSNIAASPWGRASWMLSSQDGRRPEFVFAKLI